MILRVILGCMLVLLSGCGFPQITAAPDMIPDQPVEDSFWTLRLEAWGVEKFAALLAVKRQGNDLRFIVLDTTGITLLEATIGDDRDLVVLRAVQAVRDHGLPEFLATSLVHIYIEEPREQPCFKEGLSRLCYGRFDGNHWVKYAGFGPFSRWRVDYFFDAAIPGKILEISVDSGWFAPVLRLEAY